jgi:hypothetical protein
MATPYFSLLHSSYFADTELLAWLDSLVASLVRTGAATRQGDMLHNA